MELSFERKILTTPNRCDILLDDSKEADFLLSKNKPQSRFRKPNRFLTVNRNVAFYLEENPGMEKDEKGRFKKGGIAPKTAFKKGVIPWIKNLLRYFQN